MRALKRKLDYLSIHVLRKLGVVGLRGLTPPRRRRVDATYLAAFVRAGLYAFAGASVLPTGSMPLPSTITPARGGILVLRRLCIFRGKRMLFKS